MAVQVTAVFDVLLMVAWNTCCFDAFMVAEVGLIEMLTGGPTVTTAVAETVGSATLVAVTDTVVSVLTVGAVNKPALEIDPRVADHFTARFVVLVTLAVNCCVRVEGMLADVGVTYT